jgi:nucleobase:cation symporter-1, NCS1 family
MSEDNARIERHTIFPIPLDQRHGRAGQLFTLWFGANMTVLTIVTGALATTIFGQSFASAALSILLGNLVGAIFMALHAAQGPQLGVPQMVQSRGQFGSVGAVFVVALVVFMYLGFFASNLVLGGQSLHAILPWFGEGSCLVVIGLASLAATIWGHDLIHLYTRLMTFVSGAALLLAGIWITFVTGLPAGFMALGSFTAAGFFGMLSVAALWQIAYAPYVSDYSRYLPPGTGPGQAFWASYWGCVIGSVLPMLLGAVIGTMVGDGDVLTGLVALTGPASTIIVILFALGVAASNAMNLYCGALASITLGQTVLPRWTPGSAARIVIAIALFSASILIGLVSEKNFLTNYTDFMALLLYVMVPWTAVNLVDFYLVRFGEYDVPSFFAADGGVYGRYNWPALLCYGAGILIQIPFIASDLYTGPIAALLGGVDVSWVVGLVVVSPVYYLLARRYLAAPLPVTAVGAG